MAQTIAYHDTKVSAEKSANAVAALVRKYGGSRFELQWDGFGEPAASRFALRTPQWGEVPVLLRPRVEPIIALLRQTGHFSEARASEQAPRIAWRVIHDTVEQLLLQVSLGMADVTSVFMAGLEVEDAATGAVATLGDLFVANATLAPGGRALRFLPRGGN